MLRLGVLVVDVLVPENGLSVCGKAGLGGGHAGSTKLGSGLVAGSRGEVGGLGAAERVVRVLSSVGSLVSGRLGSAGSRIVGVLCSSGCLVGSILSGDRGLVSGRGSSVLGLGSKVVGSVGDVVLLDLSLGLVLGGVHVARVGGVGLTSAGLCLTNKLRGTVGKVSGGVSCELSGVRGLFSGDGADLLGLLVDQVASVVELGINNLAIVDVDKRDSVDEGGGQKSKTPLGHDLDEEVRDEGNEEGLRMNVSCDSRLCQGAQDLHQR